MRLLTILCLSAGTAAAGSAEEIGPFDATPPTPVAPECVRKGTLIQATPVAAFGAKVYLVTWSDGSRMTDHETADIYCARVEPKTGRCLDPKGIAVCRAKGLQGRPAVAFHGTTFLVVWEDLRSGTDHDVYAARVTEDGEVLDPDGFAVIRRPNNQAWPAVAVADGQYVVAWMDARQYPVYGIYFARVTTGGKVRDTEGIPVDIEDPARIAMARPPGETWLGDRAYWWRDLASRTAPTLASNGRQCLAVYVREYPFAGSSRPGLAAALISPAEGTVTKPVRVTGGPSPAWTGTGWALGGPAWKGGWTPTPLLGAAFLPETPVETSEADATLDVVAAFGGGYNVGKGSTASFPSSAAFNGTNAIVAMQYAWRERGRDRSPRFAILLVRVSTAGAFRVLDEKPVALVTATSPRCVNHPTLAAGPKGECLIAYEEDIAVDRCVVVTRVLTERTSGG